MPSTYCQEHLDLDLHDKHVNVFITENVPCTQFTK